MKNRTSRPAAALSVVGLFAGIGGFEKGFLRAGLKTKLLCEIDSLAKQVLERAFPETELHADIKQLRSLPKTDVVAAGFPCQNLSLAGSNAGIFGEQSGLVREVFRLLKKARPAPTWVVLENVPFMLWHQKGHAIRHVTQELESIGFRWAYRVVDARAFGIPQRRRRVLLVASKVADPRDVLFVDDAGEREPVDDGRVPCGFSWTEGRAGLGWAVNAVPTLKGGSALGIPSPPAIWFRGGNLLATPEIRDAERLQGFEPDWTAVINDGKPARLGARWKLIGNAVSIPVAAWLGARLIAPGKFDTRLSPSDWSNSVWPFAAWGEKGKVFPVNISEWPEEHRLAALETFLKYPLRPLSEKATAGFLKRAHIGSLKFAPGFLAGVAVHLRRMKHDREAEAA